MASARFRPEPVRVRPLEMKKPYGSATLTSADTIIGRAMVWTHHEANGSWFWKLGEIASGTEANEAAAMKMLWLTYEHRILSALSSPPQNDLPEHADANKKESQTP